MPKSQETSDEREKPELDKEETFPASDPPTVTRSTPSAQVTPKPGRDDKDRETG